MVASINDKTIGVVLSSYQQTEQTLIEGSDEHLDLILEITNDLKQMTRLTADLVGEIEENFNSFNQNTAKDAVVKIFPCFGIANQIIGLLKKSPLYPSLKTSLAAFIIELNELKEFVSDLSKYKVQDNKELIALFNDEN